MLYLGIGFLFSLLCIGVPLGVYHKSRGRQSDLWVIPFFGGIVSAFVFGVFFLTLAIGRPVGHRTCSNWSRQTGVRTKFVLLNQFDTGTCLARTPNGHWIINSKWQVFVGVNGK